MVPVDRAAVERWVAGYERAWRTYGAEPLAELFSPDVSYLPSPWAQPIVGLPRLASWWDAEREGPDEPFTMTSDILAIDGDTSVVRVEVDYLGDDPSRWRDFVDRAFRRRRPQRRFRGVALRPRPARRPLAVW